MTEETVRLSIPVSKEINDQLAGLLPWGTKAEVIRSLIDCFLNAQRNSDKYIANDLIKGKYKLTVQNLNASLEDD